METLRYSEDGRYALVLHDGGEREAYIAVHAVRDGRVSEFGRWECSPRHLEDYSGVYEARFPTAA